MENWLKWAMEIQSLAQNGLAYCKDVYDKERYDRLREISAEMINNKTDIPIEKVKNLFCNESGYQTPKLETRGIIVKDDKILLVHENNGTWSLPGGWCDVLETVKSNTEKEVREEAGLNVKATKIIAIHDRNHHNFPEYAYNVCKVFVLCEYIDGAFKPNSETTETKFFAKDEIPENMANEKCTKAQVEMCLKAVKDKKWEVEFD